MKSFLKNIYLTMVAFQLSERLSEAKQGDLRRIIIYLERFHLQLMKYCNHNEIFKRCFLSGHSNVWDKTVIGYSIIIS